MTFNREPHGPAACSPVSDALDLVLARENGTRDGSSEPEAVPM